MHSFASVTEKEQDGYVNRQSEEKGDQALPKREDDLPMTREERRDAHEGWPMDEQNEFRSCPRGDHRLRDGEIVFDRSTFVRLVLIERQISGDGEQNVRFAAFYSNGHGDLVQTSVVVLRRVPRQQIQMLVRRRWKGVAQINRIDLHANFGQLPSGENQNPEKRKILVERKDFLRRRTECANWNEFVPKVRGASGISPLSDWR